MASLETKVVLAAPTFGSAVQISIVAQFRKLFKPEEMALRSATDDVNKQTECLNQVLLQNKPTALIAADIRPIPEIISLYKAANVPIILINEESPGVSIIAIDNGKGGRIAGDYLVSMGKKKIAIIIGKSRVQGDYNSELRLKGFQQALAAKGLSIPQGGIVEVLHYSREDGVEAMPKLLALGVDAIFCAAGDNCAQGLLNVARDRGVRIPENISIVGFDDLPIARLLTPTLTTIKQPLMEMAEAAFKMAVTERDEILRNPKKIIFNPELVIRKSA
jgi:DNA-binding LacI/PurR family transcriptional regulator